MTNDYKTDAGKPPVLEALEPFYPALKGLARMMADMAVKHRLQGAKDPFSEWKQLPEAKRRLKRAMGSHVLQGIFKTNHEDGTHLHGYHALFNLLGALTIHEEDNAETCCGAPDARPTPAARPLPESFPPDPASPRCGSLSPLSGQPCGRELGHAGAHIRGLHSWEAVR